MALCEVTTQARPIQLRDSGLGNEETEFKQSAKILGKDQG